MAMAMGDKPEGEDQTPEYYVKVVEELKDKSFKLGLYFQTATVVIPSDERGPIENAQPILMAHFVVGENAFHNRVVDPVTDKFDDQFRGIERETRDEEVERIRQEALDRMKEGKDPLGESEDDDGG